MHGQPEAQSSRVALLSLALQAYFPCSANLISLKVAVRKNLLMICFGKNVQRQTRIKDRKGMLTRRNNIRKELVHNCLWNKIIGVIYKILEWKLREAKLTILHQNSKCSRISRNLTNNSVNYDPWNVQTAARSINILRVNYFFSSYGATLSRGSLIMH